LRLKSGKFSVYEISEIILLSENTIKSRIKLFGLVPHRIGTTPTHYFDEEQIEIIKDNNHIYYESNLKKYTIVIF